MPRNLEPMLATPASELPGDDGWAYEIKWDGIRARVYLDGERLRIAARRGNDHTPRYPELAALAEAFAGRELILDGEIVAFDDDGRPSFQLLQRRMGLSNEVTIRARASETPATYIAFDLLWLDGRSLLAEPYSERRELLATLAFEGPSWQAPAHHVGDGERLWAAIQQRGLEGVVAKRLDSPYRPGQRSREWLKVRHRRGQEFVIGGWMPGEGSRGGRIGSLLVGYYEGGKLSYAGGVGTGFTQETLDRLKDAARAAAPRRLAVRARRGPAGQVRAARPRPWRRAGLGRAAAGLRGRVHRVDARGNPAPIGLQGPAR